MDAGCGEGMVNFTLIGVHVAYLLALGMFCVAVGWRFLEGRRRGAGEPPRVPRGRVMGGFYEWGDLVGLLMFFLLFYGFAVMGAGAEGGAEGGFVVGDVVFSILLQAVMPLGGYALVRRRVAVGEWLGLRWVGWRQVFGIAPLCVVGMFLFSVVLYVLGYQALLVDLGLGGEQEAVTLFREGGDPLILGLMGFAAVLVAPVCEEVVFRGYLYPVAKRFGGVRVAAVFSALIFAAAHGNAAVMLPLFVFGLLLVWVYEFTGSIWAPIAVHLLFNGTTVGIQLLARFVELPETVMK